MELRVLRYLLAVAREENVSRAAESLHVTQPTLSRQLIELEEEFGFKLFIRGGRKITMTEEGVLLRKRAEEIIDLVYKTENELRAPDGNINGDIFIGGGETDGMRIVAQMADSLQKDYPDIRFNLFSGNAEEVTARLDKGLIDFGILVGFTEMTKYESLRLPASDTWGVLMRKDSPLASYRTIKPEDLWDLPLISSRQTMASSEIPRWMKRDYEQLRIVATYNLIYNASLMVEEGMGYALSLDKLVNTAGDSALCFRPLDPPLKADIYIVWKRHQIFSKASGIFLERIHQIFGA